MRRSIQGRAAVAVLAAVFGLSVSAMADGVHVSIAPEHPQIGRTLTLVSPIDQAVYVHANEAGYLTWTVPLQAGVPWTLVIPTNTPFISGIQSGGVPIGGGQYLIIWNASTWATLGDCTLFDGVSIAPSCAQIGGPLTLLASSNQIVHLFSTGPGLTNQYLAFNVSLQAGVPTVLTVPRVTPSVPQNDDQVPGLSVPAGESVVVWREPDWATVGSLTLTTDPRQPLDFTSCGTYNAGWLDYTILQGPNTSISVPYRNAGRRVIVRIPLFDKSTNAESIAVYEQRIDDAFASINTAEVYAVTIDEENVFWFGYVDVLNQLYDYIKANYDVQVYQWFVPSGAPPGFGFPVLKADGWVSDEYWLGSGTNYVQGFKAFEKYIRSYRVLGKPMLHMIWAAPDYPMTNEYKGPLVFDEQLDVCRKYDVATSFFCYCPTNDAGMAPTWAWNNDAPAASAARWQDVLWARIDAMAVTDAERYDHWDDVDPSAPVALDFGAVVQAAYEDNFTNYFNYTNEVYINNRFMHDATITGFRDVVWNDAKEVVLRPAVAGARQASLTYQFGSTIAMKRLAVTADVAVANGYATNTVLVSLDGASWSPLSQVGSYANITSFWVRITMATSQGVKGQISNTLKLFRASAYRNDFAPTAYDGTLAVTASSAANGTLTGSYIPGVPLTYSLVANGSKGTAVITDATSGAYTYTANAGAAGADSFTFRCTADGCNSAAATIAVTVNDVPAPTLTAPGANRVYLSPASVTWTTTVADTVGAITNVSFFTNGVFCATGRMVSATVFTNVWQPAPGRYALMAKAWDSYGVGGTSTAVTNVLVWTNLHIGANSGDSAATYSAPTYTVNGRGVGITNTADAFRFLDLTMTGNCTIVARLTNVTGTATAGTRLGVMMRASTNATASEASSLFMPLNNRVYFHRRTATSGATSMTYSNAAALPYWVKLVRTNDVMKAFGSSNGTTWMRVGSDATVASAVLVGLAVTSGSSTGTVTGKFDNVSITVP